MKKRSMKKWIPKNTCYCYTFAKNGRRKLCKWWGRNLNKPDQMDGYCKYLNKRDWEADCFSLLWDQCKECSHKID